MVVILSSTQDSKVRAGSVIPGGQLIRWRMSKSRLRLKSRPSGVSSAAPGSWYTYVSPALAQSVTGMSGASRIAS